jgi:type I restriction-modification system DNA methylase subunit
MIASLNAEGRMGVVVPHGVLFRGSSEKEIRKGILENDLLEAVIGLPSSLFYGTSECLDARVPALDWRFINRVQEYFGGTK